MPLKETGVVRRIDNLGRIVIPKEVRDVLGINANDPVEIFVENGYVLLKKYHIGCIICGDSEKNKLFKGQRICKSCVSDMQKL